MIFLVSWRVWIISTWSSNFISSCTNVFLFRLGGYIFQNGPRIRARKGFNLPFWLLTWLTTIATAGPLLDLMFSFLVYSEKLPQLGESVLPFFVQLMVVGLMKQPSHWKISHDHILKRNVKAKLTVLNQPCAYVVMTIMVTVYKD